MWKRIVNRQSNPYDVSNDVMKSSVSEISNDDIIVTVLVRSTLINFVTLCLIFTCLITHLTCYLTWCVCTTGSATVHLIDRSFHGQAAVGFRGLCVHKEIGCVMSRRVRLLKELTVCDFNRFLWQLSHSSDSQLEQRRNTISRLAILFHL